MRWTPESVETVMQERQHAPASGSEAVRGDAPMSLSWPTSSANDASSNGFCIWLRPK